MDPRNPALMATRVVLGQRIKSFRQEANMTQQQVEDTLDWGQSRMSNYETGRRPVTVEDLEAIALALGYQSVFPLLVSSRKIAVLIEKISMASEDYCDHVTFVLDTLDADLAESPYTEEEADHG